MTLTHRSLWHFRRTHAAVAIGVAVATAVLVGALVVGDSVRGSLRDLTLQRLGRITHAVAPGRPFRAALAEEIATLDGVEATPIFSLRATVTHRAAGETHRASDVSLIGCLSEFWGFGESSHATAEPVEKSGAVITESLAQELGIQAGDEVVVRVAKADALPADSPLGEKSDTTVSVRVPVASVVEERGLARFALRPSQQTPRNLFLPLASIQELLGEPGGANAVLVSARGKPPEVRPSLTDYGLSLQEIHAGVWQLESEALVLPSQVVEAANDARSSERLSPVVTYLANTIRVGEQSVPYSTVAGLDWSRFLARFENKSGMPGSLGDHQIVLNQWAADDLGAGVGDTVRLTYYEPESTHGVLREAEPVELTLAGIAPLETPVGDPTPVADPKLTPELEGVTDAGSIDEWDLPFELVEPIRDQDEDYWDERSTTPKAFVSLTLAERLWGTRWGDVSLLRIEGEGATQEEIAESLRERLDPAAMGFAPQPVLEQGLAASSGSTPFDVLFLLFSVFLIASALMLVALLAQLSISARRGEIGLLGSMGWNNRAIRGQLVREHLCVAVAGAVVGALFGIGYAALLIYLLQTVWVDAITTPFLTLHAAAPTVLLGALGGLLVSWLTLRWAIGRVVKEPPRALLSGGESHASPGLTKRRGLWPAGVALLLGLGAMGWGASLRGEAAAGAFFGGGAALLVCCLFVVRAILSRRSSDGVLTLWRLAARGMGRNVGRSLLTMGLMGAASFLILATGAFRLPPTEEGAGGFSLVANSDQPLHYDLNRAEGRLELGLSTRDEELLQGARVYAFRSHAGEDASCRNLYQSSQPRVLGATASFIERGGFVWAETLGEYESNPWNALEREEGPIGVVLDYNTAVYAMKLYGGVGSRLTIRDGLDREVELEVVGLLKNSLLQGVLVVSEENFLRLFPDASGYGYFLIDSQDESHPLSAMLEDRLGDYGFDSAPASERLAGFLAVQNAYLSTFQALGALGLLLGAVGLAVAQFRSLAERRGELALLRAAGFSKGRLGRLVLEENLALLLGGLLTGALAAVVALAPLSAAEGARPPWIDAGVLVGITMLVGVVAGWAATSKALSAPITPALRGD